MFLSLSCCFCKVEVGDKVTRQLYNQDIKLSHKRSPQSIIAQKAGVVVHFVESITPLYSGTETSFAALGEMASRRRNGSCFLIVH